MRPRVLITGFPPFPGAPVNPTQWLIETLDPHLFSDLCSLQKAILPVDYATIGAELDALAGAHEPDIIIHFGLAADSTGIRLERTARNEIAAGREDNSGTVPASNTICDGAAEFPSGLPLEAIADRLESEGIPVQWSDDAGGYLCNYVFYLGRAGLCPSVRTPMTGFVHVPLLADMRFCDDEGRMRITKADLEAAAKIVIGQSIDEWTVRQGA